MAKRSPNRKRKSHGKRSPSTQELRYRISGSKGTTDGTMVGVSAVPGFKPGLKRKKPRTTSGRHSNLSRDDIRKLPRDAEVYIDGARQAKLAVYTEHESLAQVIAYFRAK